MDLDSNNIKGHSLLALERYSDVTRHMIEFDITSDNLPEGRRGERHRRFLTDAEYVDLRNRQKRREIKIRRYAHVTEGNIIYERKSKKTNRT